MKYSSIESSQKVNVNFTGKTRIENDKPTEFSVTEYQILLEIRKNSSKT